MLVLNDGQALARLGEADAELVLLPVSQVPDGPRYLLGVDDEGRAYFSVTAPLPAFDGAEAGQVKPVGLRQVGALLGDRDAGLLTHAVALANWHSTHTHCPRCGALTDPVSGGYSRICQADGSEHFPRTDPAVIVLIHDGGDRALLGRQPAWPAGRYSTIAGFVTRPLSPLPAAPGRAVGAG